MSVAYGAGLRVAEVSTLKVGDIDSERMLIRVERGKGGQYRNAMLPTDLLVLLREWWQVGRQQGVMHRDGWLFPGQHAMKPISTRQLHRIVVEAAHAADIAKRVGPHTLRHSFATHLLEDGVDIRVIQALLGHAKLENTAFYTKVATRTVRAVISPLDKLAMFGAGQAAASRCGRMRGTSLEVADIFHAAGPAYRAAHAGHLSLAPDQGDVGDRGTAAPQRSAVTSRPAPTAGMWRIAYNSCRNRHCPVPGRGRAHLAR